MYKRILLKILKKIKSSSGHCGDSGGGGHCD